MVLARKVSAVVDLGGSDLERTLAFHIKAAKLPEPVREFRFSKERMFRFDFAWPDLKVAVEAEGGTWTNGAHSRGKHYTSDCQKYNLAALDGWRVFRFTTDMIKSGEAIQTLERVVGKNAK